MKRTWFCYGCQKWHSWNRWIEGENQFGKWCNKSLREGLKGKRNDLPFMHETYKQELLA